MKKLTVIELLLIGFILNLVANELTKQKPIKSVKSVSTHNGTQTIIGKPAGLR